MDESREVKAGPAREIVVSNQPGPLNEKQAEDLLGWYENADGFRPLVGWEISRRLSQVKATPVSLDFLLSVTDDDRYAALSDMTGLCWTAKGNLYIDPTTESRSKVVRRSCENESWEVPKLETKTTATREAVQLAILQTLRPFYDKSRRELLLAALLDRFRNVPNAVRNRLLDEVDRLSRVRKRNRRFDDIQVLDEDGHVVDREEIAANEPFEPSSSLGSRVAMARRLSIAELRSKILGDERLWKEFVGDSGWTVIVTALETFESGAADGTRRDWKGRLTSAVAKRRQVSLEQARADMRKLRAKMAKASGDQRYAGLVEAFATILETPNPGRFRFDEDARIE